MTDLENEYRTSTGFSEFVAGVGWLAMTISFIVGIIIFGEAGQLGMLALPICLGTALIGLLLVVAGQSLQAQLDTANATKKLLLIELERNQ